MKRAAPNLETTCSREDITACVESPFLGYGNPGASIWLLAVEEGGAEVSRGGVALRTSLRLRAGYPEAMDIRDVWTRDFGQAWETRRKRGVWGWGSRLMLHLAGQDAPSRASVREYAGRSLGRLKGAEFCPELFPLPVLRRNFISWYGAGPWRTYKAYHAEVGPVRAHRIAQRLWRSPKTRVVVTFAREAVPLLRTAWPGNQAPLAAEGLPSGVTAYDLQRDGSSVLLIATPFWGVGKFSHERLHALAVWMRHRLAAD